jgi:L-ascorbate metabolism protein UlaG (beta-lactamase superfamily)
MNTAAGYDNMRDGVHLCYLGHASCKWVTPSGTRIVVDPYRNPSKGRWFDRSFPKVVADLVVVTHAHFDHDAISLVGGNPTVLDNVEVRQGADYTVQCIAGHHARAEKYGKENRILVIEVDGVRFCHWGDNRAEVSDGLLQILGRIDILALPVDQSEHILTLQEVAEVAERLSPEVIIPVHYFIPDLTSPQSTLKPIDDWLKTKPRLTRISGSGIVIFSETLPTTQEVWVFEPYRGP